MGIPVEELAKCQEELQKKYPSLKTLGEQSVQFSSIYWLLSDYKRLIPPLTHLENAMAASHGNTGKQLANDKLLRIEKLKKEIKEKNPTDPQEYFKNNRKTGKPGKEAQRILTSQLAKSEREAGMWHLIANANESPGAGLAASLFLRLIDNGIFAEEIRRGASWKDIGAGAAHGEYTHRIQLYCIGKAFPDFKMMPLFLTLGNLQREKTKNQDSLWDFLFDQSPVGNPSHDCRSPEALNKKLMEATTTFPTLSAWLNATHTKRELQDFDDPSADDVEIDAFIMNYWVEKQEKLSEYQRELTKKNNNL